MSIRRILVPLETPEPPDRLLTVASELARRFGAHIEVLYLHRPPSIALPFAVDSFAAKRVREVILKEAQAGVEDAVKSLRERFTAFCEEQRLPLRDRPGDNGASAEWREVRDDDYDPVVNRARLSDLIVIERPRNADSVPVMLETILLEGARPLLVVPRGYSGSIATRAAIGWNASAEASRAVGAALPLLVQCEAVNVLASQRRSASVEDLLAYLAWHGVEAAYQTMDTRARIAGASLLGAARKAECDMVVIGGYSHTRARQLLFGGVTRHLMSAADIPIFMAH